jgi:heme/copper-type cytochrome/quinol oxidase subunit 1
MYTPQGPFPLAHHFESTLTTLGATAMQWLAYIHVPKWLTYIPPIPAWLTWKFILELITLLTEIGIFILMIQKRLEAAERREKHKLKQLLREKHASRKSSREEIDYKEWLKEQREWEQFMREEREYEEIERGLRAHDERKRQRRRNRERREDRQLYVSVISSAGMGMAGGRERDKGVGVGPDVKDTCVLQ